MKNFIWFIVDRNFSLFFYNHKQKQSKTAWFNNFEMAEIRDIILEKENPF